MSEPSTNPRAVLRQLPVLHPVLNPRSYWLFLDETGLESFSGQPRFGFGGVAGYGSELVRARAAWRRMKDAHFDGSQQLLHASGKMMSRAQLDAVSAFFRASRLRRFALLMDAPPVIPPGVDGLKALRGLMAELLAEHITTLPKLPSDLMVVFELSERLTPKMMETLPGLKFSVDDEEREVALSFADKALGLEWLEMADQIAHRAQRQHREGFPTNSPLPEFDAVFPRIAVPHAQLMLTRASRIEYEKLGLQLNFRDDGAFSVRVQGTASEMKWRLENFNRLMEAITPHVRPASE